jgi:hypothetical protein
MNGNPCVGVGNDMKKAIGMPFKDEVASKKYREPEGLMR